MRLATVVVLDPGHGGPDAGCIALHGAWQEKRWTLQMARLAQDECAARWESLSVELTRDGDEFVPLSARARLARHLRADLVIAIHVDAFADPHAKGSRVFWLSEDARPYAEHLAAHMPTELRRKHNGAVRATVTDWPRVVNVLQQHSTVPAILVECGYSTSAHDFDALRDPMTCAGIAKAIAETAHLAHATKEASDVRELTTH